MQQQAQYVLELQLLYFVHSEIIDNEEVNKILWNENLKNFESLNPINQQISIIGMYGTLDTVRHFLFQRCGCTIKISDDIHNHQNREIVCFSQHQQFNYIAFIAPEEYYVKDKFEETIEISLFRFLRDLCCTIILLPSESILNNWKTINTHYYQNTTNTVQDFKIKERQDFDISIQQVQLKIESSQAQYLQGLKFGQENIRCLSRLFIFNEQNPKFEKIFQHFMIEESFIQSVDYQNQSEVVKDLIIKKQTLLTEQIGDIKLKLFNFIIESKFEQFIPREIQELAFNFCWKRQIAIIENENDEDEFGLFNSIISKSQYLIDNVGKQIDIDWVDFFNQFKAKYRAMFEKTQDIIQHLKQKFVKVIQVQLSNIYSNRSQILLVDRYHFNALSKSESTANTIETRIERVQQSEIVLFGFESFENAQVHYYFQTHLNQEMYIIGLEKNNRYQYVWIQQLLNQKIEKIFTFNQQSNQLLFYYDQTQQSLYVFNTQMGTTVIVYDEEKKRITSDKSKKYEKGCDTYVQLCYLQYYTCFFLIGQDKNIYKLSRESNSYERLQFPDDQDIKYNNVLSTGIGYYYCLANQQILDIYNFNNQRIQHVNYKDYGFINLDCLLLFYVQDDWFFILFNTQQQQLTLQVKNINTSQQIVSIQQEQQLEQYSNPYLDLIKGSIIKFGPSLLSLPTNSLKIELMIESKHFQQINNYYQLLCITETDQLLKRDILSVQGQKIQFIDFYQVLISRVPVQICTIDKSILIPLNKGQIKQKIVSQQRKIQILQKVYELDFSVIEFTKKFPQMKIYIVSIMGKQSSGKSYLLNRIFGTRFGVSSARCTDGIWMSFSIIDNILFILLDCEGLFGSRRTDEEETMLLTFITSISDATILNQDLTFDRHLNKQLNKLTNITQNISGQNLFQGQLIIVVRDVNQQEQGGAKRELLANIQQIKNSQKTSNFISKLFSDKFQLLFMSHFQAQPFETDIITLRQKLLQNAKETNNNWSDTNQLIKVIKIMLVQLELQDYRSLDEIQEEDNINNLMTRTKDLWQSRFEGDKNLSFLNKDENYNKLFQSFYYDPVKPSSIQHNSALKQVEYKIHVYMNKRVQLVRQNIGQFLMQIKDIQYQERKSIDIDNLLQNLAEKYKICAEKCEHCFLQCSLRKNHEKKIKQQKYEIEEQIAKNQLKLSELTLQFNECEKIQFESHQQLTNEQELIKNQIKFLDQKLIIEKIIQQIQLTTNCQDLSENNIFDLNTINVSSFVSKQINQYVIDQQVALMQDEVQQMIESQQFEIIVNKINDINQNLLLNQIKLQEQLQLVEKYRTQSNQQTNLLQDIQNLEINEKQLCQRILQNKCTLDELREKLIQSIQTLQTTDLDNISSVQESLNNRINQQHQFQQEIDDINSKLMDNKQLIMQKIQDEEINNYIEELNDSLNLKSQQMLPQIPFLQKKISQKNVQLQKLQQQQNQQQNQQDLLNEISILNTQVEAINEQIQVQNQKMQYLNELSNSNNYDDQFVELVLNINCSEMCDQMRQFQQQQKAVIVDIQKLENFQTIFQNQQNQNDQIKDLENLINQDQKQIDLIVEEVNMKKQIIQQFNEYVENLLDQEMQVNSFQQQILGQQNEIDRFQEFKKCLSQIFILIKQLQQTIYQLEQIKQYQSNFNKSQLIQQLNINQKQLSQFFQIKEIVDQITDCKNQIAYSEFKLQEINQQQQSNHHCGRESHICDQLCEGCTMSNKKCNLNSGHDQIHLCENQNHQCQKICKFCNHQCKNVFGHPLNEFHNCFSQHPCPQQCNFSCNQSCQFDLSTQHKIHQCKQKECDHKCYFNSQDQNRNQKCLNQCSQSHNNKHQNHLCNKVHYCNMKCDQPGICHIGTYTEEIREWQLANGRFEYLNYLQIAERKQCAILIQQGQIFHEELSHNCNQPHSCDQQCPECNAYCSNIYGHDGNHRIHKHRNKDQQCFTQLTGGDRETIIIRDGNYTREYNVGDSCTPETCQKSCERRGRAHYHLIPCQGEDKCLGISFPQLRSRHQEILYIGQNQPQDEILCEDFWQLQKWNHPVSNFQLRQEIDICNYYCSKCQESNFCNLRAWHTQSKRYEDHQFPCQQFHAFHGIDICFVVDTTQSMERHMGIISGAINKFQNAQEIIQYEDAIRYSIVTYWDHDYPYDENQIVVKSQDFTNYEEIQNFLNGVQFIYSNDHCEAMFDGLNAATLMNWRERSQKFIILIADSPPHGRLYNNYWKDNFKAGCPCGFNQTNVFPRINKLQIKLVILKFNDELNKAFWEFIKHLDSMRIIREISQKDYIQKLEEILICQEERNQEITCSTIRRRQGY